jgi:hypothetical protein
MNKLAFLAPLLLILVSCNQVIGPGDPPVATDTVTMWLAADKDAMVSCGRTGSCEEGDLNFGKHGTIVAAHWELARKQVYLHFTIPNLPPGTEIIDAYIEVFHPGKNEDGKRDDIDMPLMRAQAPWSPMTLTWRNQPNVDPLAQESYIRLRSQAWSGSPDVASLVRPWFERPADNYGMMLYWRNSLGLGVEKGFYSNNDIRRTQTDMGLSPRLLVRIKLPAGTSTRDITMPFLPSDTDLDQPRPITMVLMRQGGTWPVDWNVAPKQ